MMIIAIVLGEWRNKNGKDKPEVFFKIWITETKAVGRPPNTAFLAFCGCILHAVERHWLTC